jgi:hypothetical protein
MSEPQEQGTQGDDRSRLEPVYREVNQLLLLLPDAEDDGGLSLYTELLAVTSWRQLDAPWSKKGMQRYAGVPLIIDNVHKVPSTIDSPLDWFVVAHGALRDAGDEAVFTTSSLNVAIQLINAYRHKWLPMACIPRIGRRSPMTGRESHYLQVLTSLAGEPEAGAA